LTGPITVNVINASVSGYTIGNGNGVSGAANTLTFTGTNAGFNITHISGTTTSTAVLSGTITKTGAGRLEINNSANPSTSKYIVKAGCLTAPNSNRYGTAPGSLVSDFFTLDGGGLGFNTTTTGIDLGSTRGVTIGAGGGFLSTSANTVLVTVSSPIVGSSGGDVTVGGNPSVWTGSAHTSGGVWTLSNTNNTWNGNLILNGASGTQVKLAASGVIPDTAVVTLSAAGNTFDLNTFDETVKSISGTAGTVAVGAKTLTLNNPSGETYSSVITIAAGGKLIKNGAGAITLAGGNTNNGEIVITSGTVGVGGASVFGSTGNTGVVTISGGKLSNNTATGRSLNSAIATNLSGDFTVDDSLFNSSTPGQILFNGAATIKNSDRTITVTGTANLGFGGAIGEDTPGRSLTKAGNGILALTGANTYTGSTTILDGQLNVNGTSTLGDGNGVLNLSGGKLNTTASRTASSAPIANPIDLTADSTITTTSAAGTVDLNLSTNTVGGTGGKLTFRNDAASGTGVFQPRFSGSGFNFGQNIDIVNGASGTTLLQSFNISPTVQTFSGVIGGTGSYKRTATTSGTGGETVFAGSNTYSGGTTINDGTLTANNATGSATGSGSITIAANGILQVGNGGAAGTVSGDISSSGAVRFNRSDSSSYSGAISGTGTVTKMGAGVLTLTGTSTYSGKTTVTGGVLEFSTIGDLNVTPTALGAPTLAANGQIDLTGTLRHIGASSSSNRVVNLTGAGVIDASGTGPLTLTGGVNTNGNGLTVTGASNMTISGNPISGTNGTLTKTGPGVLTLAAGVTHTYSGVTNVTGGTMLVNGVLDSSGGAVTVGDGVNPNSGVLGGGGTINRPVNLSLGGSISPGNSVGELTTGDQTWSGGGTYVWEISDATEGDDGNGVRWDHLTMTSLNITATAGSPFTIKVIGTPTNLVPDDGSHTFTWKIAHVTTPNGIAGFDVSKFLVDTSAFVGHPNLQITVNQATDDLTLSYVPEPSSLAIVGITGMSLMRRRRRA
jgi:autotransporter-associated beta strand protein